MKKLSLFTFLITTSFIVSAQKLYVFNASYITQLGNSEQYQTAIDEENRSKFDTWPALDINQAVTELEKNQANDNHPFELVLELDENMHADLKKYFYGKTDKFEKKYPNKFGLAIYVNNQIVLVPTIATENSFVQYPNITENTSSPSNYKFFKGPNGRFTLCFREVLENYLISMKEKLLDGANEIKFVVNYDGKDYASTAINYQLNKFDYNSLYCGLGEQKYTDAAYYKLCSDTYQKAFPNNKLEEIIFSYKTLNVRKKDALPYVRYNSAIVIQTGANGKLYTSGITFKEMYNKNGSWDAMVLEEIKDFNSQELDKKCLDSYRKTK